MSTPDRIRVAMLINGYYPRIGGAERVLGEVAPHLARCGVDLHVLTRRYPGLAPYETVTGVPVHRLPAPGPKALASFAFTLAALPVMRHLQPDILHAHELFSATTTALLGKQITGAPVVVTLHRSGPPGDVQRLQAKLLGNIRMRTFCRKVDAFVTISREIDRELAAVGVAPTKRWFIPNGVDVQRFTPLASAAREAQRIRLGLPKGTITLFAGRLSPEKRVIHLVNSWPTVRALHPDANLVILGDGPEAAVLKQAAGVGVHWMGNVEDVVPYLQVADLFVLPSVAEGLSIALLEAQASGLAVVATAVGGAPDVIEHRVNGWLVAPDAVAELQAAISTLLADVAQRQQIGQQARASMEQSYDLAVMGRALRTLYEHLLDPWRAEAPSPTSGSRA